MENVIDFFSRKSYKKITEDYYLKNDELTEKHGIYIGCLIEQDARVIRNLLGELEDKHQQIQRITAEWETLYAQYTDLLQYCIGYLALPSSISINLEKDSVMISKDGHSWVVPDYKEK